MNEPRVPLFVSPADEPLHHVAPAPLPTPPTNRAPRQLLLDVATVDRSGRIPARRLARTLDWQPCDATTASVSHDTIVVRRAATGPYRIGSWYQVFVSAPLRAMMDIRTGDHVLLIAMPSAGVEDAKFDDRPGELRVLNSRRNRPA